MNYLLDVNVLIAWGWSDHADHDRTARWIASQARSRGNQLFTSAIPELGFVRVSVQRSAGQISPQEAAETLQNMVSSLRTKHGFLPDDLASSPSSFPSWCAGAARTTDAHLLSLARHHKAELATLDQGIPGAFLVPIV